MTQDYEVVIIGGGIQGAGVAQAAAAAGYRVLILEKNGWGSGTSSRSSKLIHGGLRYLQSGEFGLVRECLRERELLLRNAPELVTRRDFYLPVYRNSHYKSWQIGSGLTLYALLAGGSKNCRFSRLPKQQWPLLSGLTTKGLTTVYHYQDAQTDDRLLTTAVINSACELGATALDNTAFIAAEYSGQGYRIHIEQAASRQEISAELLVNAAGPWADRINPSINPPPPVLETDLVQGAHILIRGKLADHCFYLESPRDQRAVFALPWYDNTLVGTTETLFRGNPDEVEALPEEESYLIEVLNHYFPGLQPEIIDRFAGLRVLPKSNRRLFLRSRETQLVCDNPAKPKAITVYGGKLTSYRATANKVVKLIQKGLEKRQHIADTRRLRLTPPK